MLTHKVPIADSLVDFTFGMIAWTGTASEASSIVVLRNILLQQAAVKQPVVTTKTDNDERLSRVLSGHGRFTDSETVGEGDGRGLLVRKKSDASVGSADSFSVSRKGCWLAFSPAYGELPPGRTVAVTVGAKAADRDVSSNSWEKVVSEDCPIRSDRRRNYINRVRRNPECRSSRN